MDRCAECGFVYDVSEAGGAAPAIVAGVGEVARVLGTGSPDVRRRGHPETWSPLEYGCHVRDVLLVQRERVLAARRSEGPVFDAMGRDERVEHDGYADQDVNDVVRQLADAAQLFANVLSRLGPAEWRRALVYPYPEPTKRTLEWVAVHTQHEVQHHLLDIRRQLP